MATLKLFFRPATTSASPSSTASNPMRATAAGSISASTSLPNLVTSMSARARNFVSVTPATRRYHHALPSRLAVARPLHRATPCRGQLGPAGGRRRRSGRSRVLWRCAPGAIRCPRRHRRQLRQDEQGCSLDDPAKVDMGRGATVNLVAAQSCRTSPHPLAPTNAGQPSPALPPCSRGGAKHSRPTQLLFWQTAKKSALPVGIRQPAANPCGKARTRRRRPRWRLQYNRERLGLD